MGVSDDTEEDLDFFDTMAEVERFLGRVNRDDWVDYDYVIVFHVTNRLTGGEYDPNYDNAGTVTVVKRVKFYEVKTVMMIEYTE